MNLRYELKDSVHPTWKGRRFATLERAERELAASTPVGRFFVQDRYPETVLAEVDRTSAAWGAWVESVTE